MITLQLEILHITPTDDTYSTNNTNLQIIKTIKKIRLYGGSTLDRAKNKI